MKSDVGVEVGCAAASRQWQAINYRLTIDEQAAEDCRYTIESDSRHSGDDVLEPSADVEEIECWIRERIVDSDW